MLRNKKLIKIQNEIISYLKKRGNLPKERVLDFRYLDHGIIDSLNLIKFIIFLEKKFKIQIKTKDSDNYRLFKVGKIQEIIQHLFK